MRPFSQIIGLLFYPSSTVHRPITIREKKIVSKPDPGAVHHSSQRFSQRLVLTATCYSLIGQWAKGKCPVGSAKHYENTVALLQSEIEELRNQVLMIKDHIEVCDFQVHTEVCIINPQLQAKLSQVQYYTGLKNAATLSEAQQAQPAQPADASAGSA
ncbi:uncharacterized protein TRUGW13939_10024 [Talaromyces rugulosus]|uniref:Uncharacterized protein n=1 Tax=Talaromyces rugulosus TaxID=121627 RepID=A0A7H8R8W9_TALRU|nr:uncharacterized protein TRUGW13939_10024 [Talaromyces rugulosus]QKX62859.1 hypothetical protein TRUGW13939_10024 [Talaromyces rugulosus]